MKSNTVNYLISNDEKLIKDLTLVNWLPNLKIILRGLLNNTEVNAANIKKVSSDIDTSNKKVGKIEGEVEVLREDHNNLEKEVEALKDNPGGGSEVQLDGDTITEGRKGLQLGVDKSSYSYKDFTGDTVRETGKYKSLEGDAEGVIFGDGVRNSVVSRERVVVNDLGNTYRSLVVEPRGINMASNKETNGYFHSASFGVTGCAMEVTGGGSEQYSRLSSGFVEVKRKDSSGQSESTEINAGNIKMSGKGSYIRISDSKNDKSYKLTVENGTLVITEV